MNIWNLFGGILSFIIGAGMIYGLNGPIEDFIGYFETVNMTLYIFIQMAYIFVAFAMMFFIPMAMVITDDKGQG